MALSLHAQNISAAAAAQRSCYFYAFHLFNQKIVVEVEEEQQQQQEQGRHKQTRHL